MNECPLCGEGLVSLRKKKGWHYYWSTSEVPEPEEGYCDFCGFCFQQHTRSSQNDMLKALFDYQWGLDARIDNVDEDIATLQDFKEKIPELKKRIDFDALRTKLGYEKTKGGAWTKKEKPA